LPIVSSGDGLRSPRTVSERNPQAVAKALGLKLELVEQPA
jgi:hypothetical protein